MSNWAGMAVCRPGQRDTPLLSFFPADLALPMVAPSDPGQAAARRLMDPISDTGNLRIEATQDVAGAFAGATDRRVDAQEMPRNALEETFGQFGFWQKAAAAYIFGSPDLFMAFD